MPNPLREALRGIRAYHGSPHLFDKFDFSKIGTGEGAQAYGHGLYFGGNEATARSYRDALSNSGNAGALRRLNAAGGDIDQAIADAQARAYRYRVGGADGYASAIEEDLRALQKFKQIGSWSPGHMYEVNLDVDPNSLLDWDKPLREQSPVIQSAAHKILDPGWDSGKGWAEGWTPTGESLAGGGHGGARRSEMLRDAGIPGIQYLDQGSRAAGDGTRNYVMFDDKPISILRRYGIAGVAGAEALRQALAQRQSGIHGYGEDEGS